MTSKQYLTIWVENDTNNGRSIMTNLRGYIVIGVLIFLVLPVVAAINNTTTPITVPVENNTTAMAPVSKALLFTILGFDVDILHIVLFFVILMIVLFWQRNRIFNWSKRLRDIRNKRGKIENENNALKNIIEEIASKFNIKIDIASLDIKSFKSVKEDIIEKIKTDKTEIENLKAQLKNAEGIKYLMEIASFINLKPFANGTPKEIVMDIKGTINRMQETNSRIIHILNNSYKNIVTTAEDTKVIDPVKQAERIAMYLDKHYRLEESVKSLIRIAGISYSNDIQNLSTIINDELIPNFREYKQQSDLSEDYNAFLNTLERKKNEIVEFNEQNYKRILNSLISVIQNRNSRHLVGNYLSTLLEGIESLRAENKGLSEKAKEQESITKELERININKISSTIALTKDRLGNIKSIADGDIAKVLNIIENHLNQLDNMINSNKNKPLGFNEYRIWTQSSYINDLLVEIQSKTDIIKPTEITREDVKALIEKAEKDISILKNYRTSEYKDECHHDIPIYYENKLIPIFINDAKKKCDNGEYRDAKIIIDYGRTVIKYVTDLYAIARLRALLSLLREK